MKMTKRNRKKYCKVVLDKYNRALTVGSIVAFSDGYYNDCLLGIVTHFAEETVIINGFINLGKVYTYKYQRRNNRIFKISTLCDEYPSLKKTLTEDELSIYNKIKSKLESMEKIVFIVTLKSGVRKQFVSSCSDIDIAYEEVYNKYPDAEYIETL